MKVTVDVDVEDLKKIYAKYGSATADEAIAKIVGDVALKIKKALDIPSIQPSPAKVLVE